MLPSDSLRFTSRRLLDLHTGGETVNPTRRPSEPLPACLDQGSRV